MLRTHLAARRDVRASHRRQTIIDAAVTSRRSGKVRRAAVCSVFVVCVMSMSFFGTWTARMDSSLGNVGAGTNPFAVAVNPITNKIYVANQTSNNVTVITPAPTNAIPLNTTVTPVANNTVNTATPTFTLTTTSTYSPNFRLL